MAREKEQQEYHDNGVFLGGPEDPEEQQEALRHLEMIGPTPNLSEEES